MKKLVTAIIIAAMLLTLTLVLASCDETPACDGFEVNSFEYEIARKNPTCEGMGYIEYKCMNGGKSHIVVIEAKGHNLGEWIVDREATCDEDGYKHRTCLDCGKMVECRVAIPAFGHDLGEWVVDLEATCEADGYKHRDCLVCNETVDSDVVIPATGHDFAWTVTVEPDCVNVGYKDAVCHCGAEQKDVEIAALGHSWTEQTLAATCTVDGKKYNLCTACGEEDLIEVLAHAGHIASDAWITVDATCTVNGERWHPCKNCDADVKFDAEVIIASHDIHWIYDKDATCAEDGARHGICLVEGCGYATGTVVISNAGIPHSINTSVGEDGWIIELAPTCTDTGSKYRVCTVCLTREDAEIPALDHDFVFTERVEPDCTTAGYEHYDCSRCDAVVHTVIDAIGHDSFEETAKTGACSKCGAELYTVVIKYQLPDESFNSELEYETYTFNGDVTGIEIKYFDIAGYAVSGTFFNRVSDSVIEIIVKYQAK